MKKLLTIALLLLGTILTLRAIDYRQIEVDVTMHPAKYKALLDRFIAADTTLTNDEVSTVYYGFAFTPSYEPRDSFPEIHAAYDRKDYEEVARLIGPALELNPVSLDLSIMALAVYERGIGTTPGAKALNMAIRSDLIAGAILESGRGTFAQSPFYVISDLDRRRILNNVIGIGPVIGTDRVGDVEAIKFNFPGKSRQHILYFDNTLEENFIKSHPR